MAATSDAFAVAFGHHRAGKLQLAERSYKQILQADPHHADALHYLGVLASQSGNQPVAIDLIGKAIAIKPQSAVHHYHLGNALQAHGRLDEAVVAYQRAVRLNPNDAESHSNLGHTLRLLGRLDEAIASCQRAVELSPRDAQAHNNLGTALQARGELELAVTSFRRALEVQPNYSEVYSNLGNALQEQGQLDQAMASYQRALQLRPQNAEAYNNLGNVYRTQGKPNDALACYQRAVALAPGFALARHNRGMAWLLLGDFAQGWPEYEWRWKARPQDLAEYPQPAWQGESLEGRTILLWTEQGIGDTFQFVRFAQPVKERGGRVVLRCGEKLAPILNNCPGIDIVDTKSHEPFDLHAPLMSLPNLLKIDLAANPRAEPYLSADTGLVHRWRRELGESASFRIGIAWQGNPLQGADRDRSIPLAEFAPLASLPNVELISLQRGFGTEQLATVSDQFKVCTFDEDFDTKSGAFMDSAAVIASLDLLVMSDSALCHLAGALGAPVWVALPYAPDWRWLLERRDTPWYPTMRLFRQPSRGDWASVFGQIAAELQPTLASKTGL